MLDRLKQVCESMLQARIADADAAAQLLEVADAYNAPHLRRVCQHFMRNEPCDAGKGSWADQARG